MEPKTQKIVAACVILAGVVGMLVVSSNIKLIKRNISITPRTTTRMEG